MKPDPRTEFAAGATGDGLIFVWKTRKTPHHKIAAMLVVAAAVFVLPLMLVRIDPGSPQVRDSRPARVMLVSQDNDPMRWFEAARTLGPAPSRFDPAAWPPALVAMDEVLAGVRERGMPAHVPQFLDLPADPPAPPVPLVVKGARQLPPVAAPSFETMTARDVRPQPRLYPLSDRAMGLPDTSPWFEMPVTSEMASQPWRFLVQVAPSGAVMHALALIGHNTPGRAELTEWLRGHRFPAHDGPDGRWHAVAVTFHNPPVSNATDDP